MTIQFCGAAQEVTGSAHLLTLSDGYTILLDCGMYQGSSKKWKHFNENWLFKPEQIDCVILSHAHIDHSGRIPKLVKDGFKGNIICTHATRSLCAIMLMDSAKIQERDVEYYNKQKAKKGKKFKPRVPLYTMEDAEACMHNFLTHPYNQWLEISKGVEVMFRDAGHILGSASVTLRIQEGGKTRMFGFTGDVGRPDRPILRDPKPMPELDYLLCESTYGDQDHEGAPSESSKLLKVIEDTCVKKKGKLIIPAFSVGRTQEIVYMLDRMATEGLLPRIPVYVDSPLSVNATTVFAAHPECFDKELTNYMLTDDNPFGFNTLNYITDVEQSKSLNDTREPAIIISSSGMMNAGRVKHHLSNNIEFKRNTILIVGYCSPETPGGKLRDGVKAIRLFGEWKEVRADVIVMDSFSAHADRGELLDFIHNQRGRLRKLFLVHGTIERQEKFREMLNENGFRDVEIPALGDEFELK